MEDVQIIEGNRPGLIGEIVRWHGLYYVRGLGWPQIFETLCAEQAAGIARDFGERDDVTVFSAWLKLGAQAEMSGRRVSDVVPPDQFLGSIVMDARPNSRDGSRLRFFIASDAARGRGVGSRLLERAIAWSEYRRDPAIWLTTVAGLGASSHLYKKHGFVLIEEHVDHSWGSEHREQLWERKLPGGR